MAKSLLWRLPAAAIAFLVIASGGMAVSAAGPFAPFEGSWSGAGQVRLDSGKTEGIRCKAYYSPRSGGASLGLALRCASASNKIELRASLSSAGSRVHGSWEERSYNASGNVSGTASGNEIKLSINGGGLSGSMAVTTTGRSQSISVRTDGSGLRGVQISLRRD
jgi:hypothetical protein